MNDGPRILTLDIETSPMGAWVFDIWGQNIGVPQFRERTRVLGFGAKWLNEKKVRWHSEFHDESHEAMVEESWRLLDEADIVVHFNGRRFDIPHLNREYDKYGWTEPSPYKQVDLLAVAKSKMKFVSNKLDNIAQELGLGQKLKHQGFELWVKCMEGDPKAWAMMKRYCQQDVRLEEALYVRWRGKIPGHPHFSLYTLDPETDRCSNCGSENLVSQGYALTNLGRFPRFQCRECGRWGRRKHRVGSVDARGVAA
jgi:hypothetical protein